MIELRNVKKTYHDQDSPLEVLNIERLLFEDDTTYMVKGESGTGKTTLFNLMSGLLRADEGEILFDGQDVCLMSEQQRDRFRATQIGYVFQSFNLFKGFSAIENIMIPITFNPDKPNKKVIRQSAMEALEAVGLKGFEDKPIEKLSGGQQQRVAIARAIINDPAVILADEPTGNLDRKNGEKILDLLINVAKEREMILIAISHDLSLSKKYDTVLDIMDFNRAVSETATAVSE